VNDRGQINKPIAARSAPPSTLHEPGKWASVAELSHDNWTLSAKVSLCHIISGQVVHTHLPLSPSSVVWYQSEESDAVWLGR